MLVYHRLTLLLLGYGFTAGQAARLCLADMLQSGQLGYVNLRESRSLYTAHFAETRRASYASRMITLSLQDGQKRVRLRLKIKDECGFLNALGALNPSIVPQYADICARADKRKHEYTRCVNKNSSYLCIDNQRWASRLEC
jgi:hypothetical protein